MSTQMQICIDSVKESIEHLRSSGRYRRMLRRNSPDKEVSRFLATQNSGYLVIVGEPGIGKTGFLLNIRKGSEICYFFRQQTAQARLLNFLNYLAAELYTRIPKECADLHDWLNDPFEAHSMVNLLLKRASESLGSKDSLLICVDALDEVSLESDENVRLLKFDLPKGAYVVATTRQAAWILDQLTWYPDVETFRWEANDKRTVGEVKQYIEMNLHKGKINLEQLNIQKRSGGNILVATRLLDALNDENFFEIERSEEPLALEELFQFEWNFRILRKAEFRDFCEDIATLSAAARAPLSLRTIELALEYLRSTTVMGRDVGRSIREMRTHFELWESEGYTYLSPFHPSFTRWLKQFYRDDLCKAHRALAMTFLAVLEDKNHTDFGCAARWVGLHLRQWMKMTLDSPEKTYALNTVRELIERRDIQEEIEQQCGTDVYMERILREGAMCGEEANSLSVVVRFGIRYLEYQREATSRLGQLEHSLTDNKLDEAVRIARTLPEGNERLGCLGLIGCWAIDNNRSDLLDDTLEKMAEEAGKSFGPFIDIAWSLMGRLVNIGRRDLLGRFLSLLPAEDFRKSIEDYLTEIQRVHLCTSENLDFIEIFLNKALACDIVALDGHVLSIARTAFQYGASSCEICRLFLNFLPSIQDSEIKIKASLRLAELFITQDFIEAAIEAVDVAMEELSPAPIWVFYGVVNVIQILREWKDRRAISYYERLLEIISEYDRAFEFFRAEALVQIGLGLEILPIDEDTNMLRDKMRSAANFEFSIFRDYVGVQLTSIASRHCSYEEAAAELKSIEDPLCRTWAQALIVGEALDKGGKLSLDVMKQVSEGFGENRSPSAGLLIFLAQRIINLAAKPVFVPLGLGSIEHQGRETGYPHFCSLAIADIGNFLVDVKNMPEGEVKIFGHIMQEAVRQVGKDKLEIEVYPYEAMDLLLKVGCRIVHSDVRRAVLSTILDNVMCLHPYYRCDFLQGFAATLKQKQDEDILERLMESLPSLLPLDDRLDFKGDLLFGLRTHISPILICAAVRCVVDEVESYKKLWGVRFAGQFIEKIPKLIDSVSAKEILSRLRCIYVEENRDLSSFQQEEVIVALVDSYTQLGLCEEAKQLAKLAANQHGPKALLHLGFLSDLEGRHVDARRFFIEALKTDKRRTWQRSREEIRGSLAVGFTSAGFVLRGLEELTEIHEPSRIVDALIKICAISQPSLQENSEFDEAMALINKVLADAEEPANVVKALSVKARYFRKAGFEKEALDITQEALNTVMEGVSTIGDRQVCYDVARASASLSKLVIESGNDAWLRKWLDTALEIGHRFKSSVMFDALTDVMTPEIAKEKEWLLSRIIQALRDQTIGWENGSALWNIARILRSIEDDQFAIKYWKQFLRGFSRVKLFFVIPAAAYLSDCLAKSHTGKEKVRLFVVLCRAALNCLSANLPEPLSPNMLKKIVHTVVHSATVENKEQALNAILSALPGSCEDTWSPVLEAVVAEGWSLLGYKEKASSLFRKSMSTMDRMLTDFDRKQKMSEIALIMVECGFAQEAEQELQKLGKMLGLESKPVRKNAAMGLLQCGDINGAMTIADEFGDSDVKVEIAGELFAGAVHEYIAVESFDSTHKADNNKRNSYDLKQRLLERMEENLAVITEAGETYSRDEVLQRIAQDINKLPLKEAIKWWGRLPTFSESEEGWKALCAEHKYDLKVVELVLDTIQDSDTKSSFISELLKLDNERLSGRLCLLLSAWAIVDSDCFFNAICHALENCTDLHTLEEVKREVDEIEGICGVISTKKDVIPTEKMPYVSEQQEEEKINIIFTNTTVLVNREDLGKGAPLLLAEYIILKQNEVHWLWAYIILPKFEVRKYTPVKQFRNYISKRRKELAKYGIHLAMLKDEQEDFVIYEGMDDRVVSNIRDARKTYEKAFLLSESNLREAVKVLSYIIEDDKNRWYNFTDAYMTLSRWICKLKFEGVSDGVIEKCIGFFKWYLKRLKLGISKINHYKAKDSLDDESLGVFEEIKSEFRKATNLCGALTDRRPLNREEQSYESFVNVLLHAYEALVSVRERLLDSEGGQNDSIRVIKFLSEKSKDLAEMAQYGRDALDKLLERKGQRHGYSEEVIQDMHEDVYWEMANVILEIENFDKFDRKPGNKLTYLKRHLCSCLRQKLSKYQ